MSRVTDRSDIADRVSHTRASGGTSTDGGREVPTGYGVFAVRVGERSRGHGPAVSVKEFLPDELLGVRLIRPQPQAERQRPPPPTTRHSSDEYSDANVPAASACDSPPEGPWRP